MRKLLVATLFASILATPAFAQNEQPKEFEGFYVGVSAGATVSDEGEGTILFDRDLNGSFGDTVTTASGANAFSTGFCSGSVSGPSRPAEGCETEETALELSIRGGFDWQMDTLVVGLVGEIGTTDYTSSATAFSTTPASYTFNREIEFLADLRGRIGFTATPTTLVYGTGGVSYAQLDTSFVTTNTANGVDRSGLDEDSFGYVLGLGVEQKLGRNFSIGVEYLYREFEDESTVRLINSGTTPATNPFLLGNANGTDFARNADKFNMHSVRAVLNFRF